MSLWLWLLLIVLVVICFPGVGEYLIITSLGAESKVVRVAAVMIMSVILLVAILFESGVIK
ncbi:MAG: hypothetical protein CMJ78_02045 [Planctomycetaceae bacterium]|nr:hypothetical protein [Planctomycetaceae bacterium]